MEKTRKTRQVRGITLVALVVTIVVLIILATISVGALFGEKGIIKQAKEAKEAHENGRNEEEKSLEDLMTEYNKVKDELASGSGAELPDITSTTPAGTQVKKPNTWTSEKVIAIADGKGGLVPLPNGYHYVGGDINTGLVISDKAGDTIDASGVDMRKPVRVDTSAR